MEYIKGVMEVELKITQENRNEIERCQQLALSRNPRDRSFAAKRLGDMKAKPETLVALLQDLNGFVRSAAAEALGHFNEDSSIDVVSHLMSAIDDPNHYVCAAAINSLGLLSAVQAISQIETCLEDEHPIIIQASILSLARINPESIRGRLPEFLASPEYLIHLAAVRACGWITCHACGEQILQSLKNYIQTKNSSDLKLPKLYIDVLTRLEVKEAIPTLVEIAEREVGLRGLAVEALVEMNAKEAASVLSPLLSDPSNRLRRNLIEMMIQANYKEALPLVRTLLKDHVITIRETALAAISKWQDRVSEDDVRNMAFNDPNPFVRPQAVVTLTKLLGQDALDDLIDLSDDLNLHVRRSVAQCLAEIDYLTPEGKTALLRLAKDKDTTEFAQAALRTHDLNVIREDIVELPKTKTSIPDFVLENPNSILGTLEAWQENLPAMRKHINLEELSEIDRALSTLIIFLREAL